jgi:NAD(P)-dependent dehydrogenase (short-subunit alcohol dehydrogenase family)
MKQLNHRVAVVTGGASGIGRGMAEQFAANGMKVMIADIEAGPREETVEALRATGAEVVGIHCDVASAESVANVAKRVMEVFGAVHVLCNNAGVLRGGFGQATWEKPLSEWEWILGVNLWGVIHGIRSFVPLMLAHGDEGHIVNTASMAGLIHGTGINGITKHAVVALSESLYTELQARQAKIGVSVLCPGAVNTRILEAERNRPEAPERPLLSPDIQARLAAFTEQIKNGLDPSVVGQIVVHAILCDRFYVFTHPGLDRIRQRMECILADGEG